MRRGCSRHAARLSLASDTSARWQGTVPAPSEALAAARGRGRMGQLALVHPTRGRDGCPCSAVRRRGTGPRVRVHAVTASREGGSAGPRPGRVPSGRFTLRTIPRVVSGRRLARPLRDRAASTEPIQPDARSSCRSEMERQPYPHRPHGSVVAPHLPHRPRILAGSRRQAAKGGGWTHRMCPEDLRNAAGRRVGCVEPGQAHDRVHRPGGYAASIAVRTLRRLPGRPARTPGIRKPCPGVFVASENQPRVRGAIVGGHPRGRGPSEPAAPGAPPAGAGAGTAPDAHRHPALPDALRLPLSTLTHPPHGRHPASLSHHWAATGPCRPPFTLR